VHARALPWGAPPKNNKKRELLSLGTALPKAQGTGSSTPFLRAFWEAKRQKLGLFSRVVRFLARHALFWQQAKRQKLGFFSRVVTTKIDIERLKSAYGSAAVGRGFGITRAGNSSTNIG
jgi:hypothetical protein